jgi:GAF domain-containing protein
MNLWNIISRRNANNMPGGVFQGSDRDLQNKLALRTRELHEALEQQAGTGEILRIISSSPTDVQPVFDAIARSAARLCEGFDVVVYSVDGNILRLVAHHGPMPAGDVQLHQGTVGGRTVIERRLIHTLDLQAEVDEFPEGSAIARERGHRTNLSVPLLREDIAIGNIQVRRQEVRPFSDKQISLLKTFADQAVIAIENMRLFDDVQKRTQELSESLEQQTATSEVLGVISSSPGELHPVFETMLSNAVRLCEAKFGILFRFHKGVFLPVAYVGVPPALSEFFQRRGAFHAPAESPLDHLLRSNAVVHWADVAAEPVPSNSARFGGARALIAVPMFKETNLVGAIVIYRQEVRPFTDKQIELVKSFASQAVIAIENARLLNELRQRTADLSESLEQQTATSEVLRVISSSPGELQPVFETILENATRICAAKIGILFRYENGAYSAIATLGVTPAYAEYLNRGPIQPGPTTGLGRVASTRQTIHIADTQAEQVYAEREPLRVATAELGGARSLLNVPMLKEGELIGAIGIYRQEVRPFTEKQIALVTNFAHQVVIAIENTRLLNELRESLQQQTATADVLKVISRSTFDLQTVLNTLVESVARLCKADIAAIHRQQGSNYQAVATSGGPADYWELIQREIPFKPGKGSVLGRTVLECKPVQVADVLTDPDYTLQEVQKRVGFRTSLGVPLLREGNPIGAIVLMRLAVRPFTDEQIDLATTFADQAVIAIENVRLFEAEQQRTRELSESLEQQTATSEVLRVISSSPTDLKTALGAIAESAARLLDVTDAHIMRREGDVLRLIARHGPSQQWPLGTVRPINRNWVTGRAVVDATTVHVPDLQSAARDFPEGAAYAREFGHRTTLATPLMREGHPVGAILIRRMDVRPFTEKQTALLGSFADQAVIAIENVRLFDEIQDKSRQLAEASQHKSQFLANMSHELRTPLNAILGYTELILDNIYGDTPEQMRGVLQRIESNGRHLLGLINDVLDLSKIEAGQLVLALTDYSLRNVVQTVFSVVEPLASEKKLAFKVEVAPDMPTGHGDERRLTQVLLNLVGNAIKFTDAGEVVIKASQTDASFNIAVCDTGPGISATDQAKLFQEFQQADNSITRKKGGTGLGLAISKRIVEMHGVRSGSNRRWVAAPPSSSQFR